MKSASTMMKNTLLLAANSIAIRFFVLCFQAYLAAKLGAEQLGIFGIITSVGAVFATISISGVRFGVTRIVAEEISVGNEYPRSFMGCAFRYGMFFGTVAGAGLYMLSGVISKCYIGDVEAALPLKIIALSMPAISLGSCVEGYFTAKQKIFRLISVQLISQCARIGFVLVVFGSIKGSGFYPADILATGTVVGEFVFASGMLALYFCETRKQGKKKSDRHCLSRLVKIASPLAVSAYMRTGLSSLGQVIIPSGLKKAGMTSVGAFASYGIIAQMAIPVIMFPAALMSALGEVLVPRLTEAQVGNKKLGISYIVNRALRIGIMFSFGIMGIMLFYSDDLAVAIYKNSQAGQYIKILAPIIPIIYIDCITDGCLKGLGQQVYSMIYNVLEGVINVVLLFILLPKAGLAGYMAVMYIKEVFNTVISLYRLGKVAALEKEVAMITAVTICMTGAWLSGNILARSGAVPLKIVIYCTCYVALLYVVNYVSREDIKWVANLLNPRKHITPRNSAVNGQR